MNKVARFQILPIETEQLKFTDISKILWGLQHETLRVANRTVQLCWEFSGFESEYKKKFDAFPDVAAREKEIGYKSLNSYIYSTISKEFSKLNTGNLSTTMNGVFNKFKGEKIKYLKGELSVPSFKSTIPIDVHGKNICMSHDDKSGQWNVELSLLSNVYKGELGLPSGKLSFKMIVKSGSQKSILECCHDEEYKICASKIIYKNGKWFLNLTYGFDHEVNKPEYSNSRIMGCYLGEFNAVYCTFNDSDRYLRLDGGEVEFFRQKIEARRKSLLQQSKECGDGRKGHGYHTRVKPVETLSSKISNYRNTINHKYSKLIIDFARKNNCGMIYLEDLKGISEENKFLKNWSYFDLQNKIVYKSKQEGIETYSIKLDSEKSDNPEENTDSVVAKRLASYDRKTDKS